MSESEKAISKLRACQCVETPIANERIETIITLLESAQPFRDAWEELFPKMTHAEVEAMLQESRAKLESAQRDMALMKTQVRVSDEAFNFHLKRANKLAKQCDELESKLAKAEAAGAEMREFIDGNGADQDAEQDTSEYAAWEVLNSTTLGKPLLAKLERMESALGTVRDFPNAQATYRIVLDALNPEQKP